MKHNKVLLNAYCSIAFVSVFTLSACNNNDTSSTTNTVSTVTSTTMMVDTSNKMNTIKDTTKPMVAVIDTSTNMTKKTVANAKPDPAKKGKKGKVTIAEVLPSKIKADAKPDATGTYKNVDYIPSFPGGYKGLQKYFDDNLQYPAAAQDNGVEGTVRVGFTVDENGKLMNPTVEGINEGYGLDEEAIRVIRKMPTWVPGKINGKAVKTKFTLPVRFILD